MRAAIIMALCLVAAACGVKPGTPPIAGSNELQTRPGLFSGTSGDFLVIGTDPPPEEAAR